MTSWRKSFTEATPVTDRRLVTTEQGSFQGVPAGNPAHSIFRGVPFAAPPTGPRRWLSAGDPEPFSGVRDCSRFAPICTQAVYQFSSADPETRPDGQVDYAREFYPVTFPQSEDSLYLNLWTPCLSGWAPVMVWIHGGAYDHGYSYEMEFDGEAIAARGCLLVTVPYRLAGLGFFAHPELSAENGGVSGNQAVSDVLCALRWINKYIAAFGGDPDNVTVFGQSAGGDMVQRVLCAPGARGLLRRAVVHSAGGVSTLFPEKNLEEAEADGAKICAFLKRSPGELRELPAGEVFGLIGGACRELGVRLGPITDGRILDAPCSEKLARGELNAEDIMCGTVTGDAALFGGFTVPKTREELAELLAPACGDGLDRALALLGDDVALAEKRRRGAAVYAVPTVWAMSRLAAGLKPIHIYNFARALPGDRAGAFHSSELWYVFGTLERCWRAGARDGFTDADRALSQAMLDYWTAFAATGDPCRAWLPQWPAYTVESPATMVFDAPGPHWEREPGCPVTGELLRIYAENVGK